MKVKTGQTVKVLSGKDKGKSGKVLQVFPSLEKVVVEGVNQSFKHLKRRRVSGTEKGERVDYFAPIHVANVKVVDEQNKKTKGEKEKKIQNKTTTADNKTETTK